MTGGQTITKLRLILVPERQMIRITFAYVPDRRIGHEDRRAESFGMMLQPIMISRQLTHIRLNAYIAYGTGCGLCFLATIKGTVVNRMSALVRNRRAQKSFLFDQAVIDDHGAGMNREILRPFGIRIIYRNDGITEDHSSQQCLVVG